MCRIIKEKVDQIVIKCDIEVRYVVNATLMSS